METLPQVFSTGWASGVNAYATVLVLGLLQRVGVDSIPEALGRPEVLLAVGALFCVEVVVDKIPYLDSVWDTVHTAIRPAIGAALGALLASEGGDLNVAVAASTSGATALASHAVKAGFRLAVNLSPEPFSNFIVSTAEDVTVVFMVVMSLLTPWLAAAIAAVMLATGLWIVWHGARWLSRHLRSRRARPLSSEPVDIPGSPNRL
jgi:hypothetical protein